TDRTVLTMLPPNEARRALDFMVRNRDRFDPVSPPRPIDFYTLGFHERSLDKALDEFEHDQSLRLFVFRRGQEDSGPVAGAINFPQFSRLAFQRCILGYSVDAACEGQGILREALEAVIGYVFDELGFHRIEANHLPENARSAGLLRKLG